MYVGRIVAVGRTPEGANAALYRVSSRSFPNRQAVDLGGKLAIVPRAGHEADIQKNPYIAYNCVRTPNGWAIATNGSHTDPIAEKVALGVPLRDALASCLLAMDYEKDDYDTPRIAAAVPVPGATGWPAPLRRDALIVTEVPPAAGQAAGAKSPQRRAGTVWPCATAASVLLAVTLAAVMLGRGPQVVEKIVYVSAEPPAKTTAEARTEAPATEQPEPAPAAASCGLERDGFKKIGLGACLHPSRDVALQP